MMLGLQYLHSIKIIHVDIKPSNVLITADWKVKLIDLNCAKTVGEDMKAKGAAGTAGFQAPEMLVGEDGQEIYGPSADVFSGGITLWMTIKGNKDRFVNAPDKPGKVTVASVEAAGKKIPDDMADDDKWIMNEALNLIKRMIEPVPDLRIDTRGIFDTKFMMLERNNVDKMLISQEHNLQNQIQDLQRQLAAKDNEILHLRDQVTLEPGSMTQILKRMFQP